MLKRMMLGVFAVLTVLSITSCREKRDYRDDMSAEELAARITQALPKNVSYQSDESDLVGDYLTLPESVTEYVVFYAEDTNNINEFGVYHVTKGGARALESMILEKYLEGVYLSNRDWYDSYIPGETGKLRDAEVRTYGDYVVYAILSPDDKEVLFDTVEKVLKQ